MLFLRSALALSAVSAALCAGGCSSDPGSTGTGDNGAGARGDTGGTTGATPAPSPTGTGSATPPGPRPLGPPQTGGVLLDAHGGLHPFGGAKIDTTSARAWPSDDIARALVVLSDGSGGWVLDGYGGVHEFGQAPKIASPKYTAGKDWARALVVLADQKSGYLLDAGGKLVPFGSAPEMSTGVSWTWDIARGLDVHLDGAGKPDGGWLLDGWGGMHKFGAAPDVGSPPYYDGYDLWSKVHVVKDGAYVIGRFGIIQPVGKPAGISLAGLPDYKDQDLVRDIVPLAPAAAWDKARTLDCPTSGWYCGMDGMLGAKSVLYQCAGTGGAPAKATVCAHGCFAAPAGTPDYCVGELSCGNVQWWNTALTYGPYQSSGYWDTDLAVSGSTPVQLRHDSKLTKVGVYGWGFMPEFIDMVTGKEFRFLHLRPQHQYVTNVGQVYPAGTVVGVSGGDTADTGLPTYSTGAHLCVQSLEEYRVVFPTGHDACQ